MTSSTDLLSLFVPLTTADREQAERIARLQVTDEEATRVYRNTLAVLATAQYLKMLDIDSDLEASYSFNPAVQLVADMADLYIPETRRCIECRSVHPGESRVYIPEEVWEDRLGFVIVQINDNGTRADLLGFVTEVSIEQLPLSYLHPLDELVDVIEDTPTLVTVLSDWLQGKVSEAWRTLTEIAQPPIDNLRPTFRHRSFTQNNELAQRISRLYSEQYRSSLEGEGLRHRIQQLYSQQSGAASEKVVHPLIAQIVRGEKDISEFAAIEALVHLVQNTLDATIQVKAAELLWMLEPEYPATGVWRILDQGLKLEVHPLALMVAVLPRQDGRLLVLARTYSLQQPYMPTGITLSGLDEVGNDFFAVQSRRQDNYIQYYFVGDYEDSFSLQMSLGASKLTENFQL
ncbi:DUF1822 family protein [Leptothoe sp. PORK10 BA2]|uniref:DUF1822 family protein n=1 Tax=Leptothoe sp. PORK10 BA2 TaxID=3110254 RepID=UPI002B2214EA|nr:DUF1822 family protein [Leptothoe sp. PORK10 BA2]MEA5467161.1 DUF1822 family protein [Leptothoe sp. PORK10 BA2]